MAKHGDLSGSAAVHQAAYYQDADPNTTNPGEVQNGDLWINTTGSPPYQLSLREGGAWVNVGATGGFSNPMDSDGDLIRGGASGAATKLDAGAVGQQLVMRGGTPIPTWEDEIGTIQIIIDGGGVAITTGVKGDLEIPFACVIQRATLLADQSGSIVIDIWKDTYANFPPTDPDSITASAPPTISGATKSQDSTLTGWTTSIAAGDTLRFNVDSCATITRVTLSLKVKKA